MLATVLSVLFISSFNPQNNPMKYLLLFSLVYRKRHLGINAKSHAPDQTAVEQGLGPGSLAMELMS